MVRVKGTDGMKGRGEMMVELCRKKNCCETVTADVNIYNNNNVDFPIEINKKSQTYSPSRSHENESLKTVLEEQPGQDNSDSLENASGVHLEEEGNLVTATAALVAYNTNVQLPSQIKENKGDAQSSFQVSESVLDRLPEVDLEREDNLILIADDINPEFYFENQIEEQLVFCVDQVSGMLVREETVIPESNDFNAQIEDIQNEEIHINADVTSTIDNDFNRTQPQNDERQEERRIENEERVATESKNTEQSERKRKKNSVSVAERKKIKIENLKLIHTVLPPCGDSCKKKCQTKINKDRRIQINKEFWNLNSDKRRSFIFSACNREIPRRRTSEVKKSTFTYTLSNENGTSQKVCKVFFLTTLGYNKKNDKIITTVLTRTPKDAIQPNPDLRGKAPSKQKGPWDEISEHIETYHPEISHYRREHAPNRKYLPSDITVLAMHENFLEKFPQFKDKVSYDQYRKVVKSKNISFAKLGHEECENCEEFNKQCPHSKENKDRDCDVCKRWEEHINKAKLSREAYRKFSEEELPEGTICFTCDLQKVIMLPRVDTFKKVLFLKRLIAYNETYAPVGKKSGLKPLLCVWHEAISGRKKEELVSTFYRFLKEYRDCNVIHLWMDNCSSQNKNWCLFSFLINIINTDQIAASEINLWYFEPGHTFMSADSVHQKIELALKHQGKTYDFDDYVTACKSKGTKEVVEMKAEDFFFWEDGSSKEKLKIPGRVKLADISHVKAERGSFVLKYKKSYEEKEYKRLDFLQKKLMKKKSCKIPRFLSHPRGFDAEKRDRILKDLAGILPENRKLFWENLPIKS